MAEHVHDEIREVAPWLAEPQFAPSVHRYLRAAAREQLLDRFIQETCDTKGPAKVPARAWEQATAATRLAASLAADLGLTPTGHARLKQLAGSARVTEITLGELQAQGREVRLAAEARMAAPALDPDDQEDA